MSFWRRTLDAIRVSWRPIAAVGIAASVWTYGVFVPIYAVVVLHQIPSDGVGLAADRCQLRIGFAVREVGKAWGTA